MLEKSIQNKYYLKKYIAITHLISYIENFLGKKYIFIMKNFVSEFRKKHEYLNSLRPFLLSQRLQDSISNCIPQLLILWVYDINFVFPRVQHVSDSFTLFINI